MHAKALPSPTQAKGTETMLPFPAGATILFQGDSITDGGRWNSPDLNHIFGQGYVYLIAAECSADHPEMNWTFINRGVSGNTVNDLAARWQADTLDLKPDVLSIMIGVNDTMGFIDSKGSGGVSATQYEQVYDQIIQQALAANPSLKLVFGEPFIEDGARTDSNLVAARLEIKLRQSLVEGLALKYHAPVVHYQAIFDKAIASSSQPVTYWVWDGVHPTAAGHELMAREWLRTVRAFYDSPHSSAARQ